ncbi:MAG: ribosome biogenesis GTPase Der [Deltaproteobacteria bacterium]|nr:ribosome biogenesis GTPase Der [Deltaproteobacteria bacterium]
MNARGSPPLVALVGRPNVGKSTLFNRLVGRRKAAVAPMPGLTRDRNYDQAEWLGRRFRIVDTGGLDRAASEHWIPLLEKQTLLAIGEADVVLCLLDARQGITAADQEVVDMLRRSGKPVVYVANKVDTSAQTDWISELSHLGLDPLVPISAEHGIGIEDAVEAALALLPSEPDATVEVPPDAIRVAIVGRPNVGKSSLLNRLAGLERALVDSRPGTTIDPVDTLIEFEGRPYLFVDTAGIRRHKSSALAAESIGVTLAFRAIERCQVALVLLDAADGVTAGDVRVAGMAEERGSAVALVINKWDLVDPKPESPEAWQRAMRRRLGLLEHAPIVTLSAKTGQRVHRLFALVDRLHAGASRSVSTSELNRVLREAVDRNPPPLEGRRPVRIYYGVQRGTLPPRFLLFSNRPQSILVNYKRYLVKRLREAFGFEGSPVWIEVRGRTRGRRSEAAEESVGADATDVALPEEVVLEMEHDSDADDLAETQG